ncbi:unnamed protein product, partial [marine sediment metagenome]
DVNVIMDGVEMNVIYQYVHHVIHINCVCFHINVYVIMDGMEMNVIYQFVIDFVEYMNIVIMKEYVYVIMDGVEMNVIYQYIHHVIHTHQLCVFPDKCICDYGWSGNKCNYQLASKTTCDLLEDMFLFLVPLIKNYTKII